MSLLDELSARRDGRGARECGVAYALRQLDEHTADKFRAVFEMSRNAVQSSEIHRALEEEGIRIGYDSVRRHRERVCQCADAT